MKKLLIVLLAFGLMLTGCSGEEVKDVDLTTVMTTVQETYEFGMMENLDAAFAEDVIGLTPDMYDSFAVAIPMINTQATEIIMIKAKDGQLDAVKTVIDNRMADLDQTWSTYLPDQHDLVKNAQRFEIGNYYFTIIHKDAEAIKATIEVAFE